jgi:F-box and leucine-rich repeat protein 2/20
LITTLNGSVTTSQTTTAAAFNNNINSVSTTAVATTSEDEISKKLPKEILLRILSYLDVVSLCRCAQVGSKIVINFDSIKQYPFPILIVKVSKYWNILALDGSNWQKIDLFDFQRDIEVREKFLFVSTIKQ